MEGVAGRMDGRGREGGIGARGVEQVGEAIFTNALCTTLSINTHTRK